MNEDVLDDLCRKIYKNHRQAIDLIVDRVGTKELSLVPGIAKVIEGFRPEISVVNHAMRRTAFIPKTVREAMPPIGAATTLDPHAWIVWKAVVRPNNCVKLVCECWRTTDIDTRLRVIEAIKAHSKDLGLTSPTRTRRSTRENSTARLSVKTLYRWREGDEPNDEGVQEIVQNEVEAILRHAPAMAQVITDALSE